MNKLRKMTTATIVLLLTASVSSSLMGPVSVHATDSIIVYVGYADDARPNPFFPNPWCGSPNVIFIGACSGIDAGVVRIDNTGSSSVTISSVTVLLPGPTPSNFYCCRPITISYYPGYGGASGPVTIPAGDTLILSQTAGEFGIQDTSDYSFEGCRNPAPIGVEFPVVTVTTGSGTQVWNDQGHTIDTEGFDFACIGNENLQWRPAAPPFFEGNPELEITPFKATNMVGASHTLTATLISNQTFTPIVNGNVTFTVTGANNLSGSCVTNTSGKCTFTYTGTKPGLDTIVGSAVVGSVLLTAPAVHKLWTSPPLKVSKFFTDTSLNPLSLDKNGNPKVDVVLAGSIVRSTNPGEIIAWVNVTNTVGSPVQSLKLNETLPVDWLVSPTWLPAKGAIHVFYANTTSLTTNPEITDPSTITVTTGNPQTVLLSIPSLNATAIGHPLLSGQSILLAVKLDYGLAGTSQSAASYPRNYTDVASAAAWSKPSFTGSEATATASGFFIAYAKVVGDVNGDLRVDITDLALVASSFGAAPGSSNWNSAADLNNDGRIDIADLSVVAAHFGS